ncbi:hypothetical protein [Legionella worsleiensis]|uniref:Uncharacterized protein n=1 Tax=Legionella worsleiensis TaxID=45076 RepID=A0A0W1AA63_9GAMM|nr:hypothetical protein [Legionella worsleiensis]KTD78242.1 hypothetical protein Lwor_1637 [Legionella worsleiensis]STY32579.1 Uncharacterised protein [Legionella worsleiensis]
MNSTRKPFNLAEARIQASLLLKSLRSSASAQALKRFRLFLDVDDCVSADVLLKKIKLKHALAVIAMEHGFKSWLDLKMQLYFIVGGYLNLWFADYAEARLVLQEKGGYLLPYKHQFFICSANYIKHIGFDPDDPDWEKIGFDWAKPSNQMAWQRLYKKWKKSVRMANSGV